MITKINHIAIVAPDLDEATGFWAEALGLTVTQVEDVSREAVKIAFLPVGESQIELLQPTTADSGVAKYLDKRGPGLHHICLEVDDIEATLDRLKAANVPLINETAVTNEHGTRYAFIHPKGAGGVMVELYEIGTA